MGANIFTGHLIRLRGGLKRITDRLFLFSETKGIQMPLTLRCDCTLQAEAFHHEWDCSLWDDDDFYVGAAQWDGMSLIPTGNIEDEESHITQTEAFLKAKGFEGWECPWFYDLGFEDDGLPHEFTDEEYLKGGGIIDCLCTTEKEYRCGICGVERQNKEGPWKRDSWRKSDEGRTFPSCNCLDKHKLCVQHGTQRKSVEDQWTYYSPPGNLFGTYKTWEPKCTHNQQKVEFPSGKLVHCTSAYGNGTRAHTPDLHVMLDTAQKPTTWAWYIPWRDHGLPVIDDTEIISLVDVMETYMGDGKFVETGCIGAHGRTGVLLALLYMKDVGASQTTGEAAIEWVRTNYCKKAVEGVQQELYVEHMRLLMMGTPSERPTPPVHKNETKGKKNADFY